MSNVSGKWSWSTGTPTLTITITLTDPSSHLQPLILMSDQLMSDVSGTFARLAESLESQHSNPNPNPDPNPD